MIILILISIWNSLEERKANQKIDELMQKVKLLTIIAHTEFVNLYHYIYYNICNVMILPLTLV